MLEAPEIRIIGRKILDEAMQECACLDAELT
jgi:hypothetical protein